MQAQCSIYSCPFCKEVDDSEKQLIMHIISAHVPDSMWDDIIIELPGYESTLNETKLRTD